MVEDAAEPERDMVHEAATAAPEAPRSSSSRRVLAAVFWLLASLAVLVGGITLWAHQTLVTSNGWGGIVEEVISEPEVVDAMSVVVVDRLSDTLGLHEIVADVSPGPQIVAGAHHGRGREQGRRGSRSDFAESDAFQDGLRQRQRGGLRRSPEGHPRR